MNPYNPYDAPRTTESVFGQDNNEDAQAAILASMSKTRPWVLFLAVLGFFMSGITVLVGLFVMVVGTTSAAFAKGGLDKMGPFLGIIYIIFGGFYMVPSWLLWSYGSSIANFKATGGSIDALKTAIQKQTSFWRFVGISTALLMGLYFVIIFIAVIVGIFSAVAR